MAARANSPGLSRRMLASPRRSISLIAMMKTMEPSTQRGKYCTGLVRNEQHHSDDTAVHICANWLRPPELSTIAVWVGLPLTTKVPLMPAAAFAAERPTMSSFSSSGC